MSIGGLEWAADNWEEYTNNLVDTAFLVFFSWDFAFNGQWEMLEETEDVTIWQDFMEEVW